ncbi:hypothetical protein OSJ77_11635 [Phyllobacterium sp. 0TCS1.6C]|uniref:hypothetical protein n=1 Tax=unclassified Phyllobacterium TaxID=2638441 RepID=UPI002263D1E0|nr:MULTISPECIES: hypothetical protein [unclassified Phyllobacterium]MCX8280845.1 hypothetical protein [Phyllobacterium sp. 0TCS1.6C]MCX8295711.1 hypothetical protein [Phyllobacterium sp. 0TCS1.6A]
MKDADAALAAIDQQIVKPVDQATQHWMDIAFAGNSEPYRPYASCVEAGTELHQYAARVSRYLRGIEPRKIEPVYAETFMARLEECEAALGH